MKSTFGLILLGVSSLMESTEAVQLTPNKNIYENFDTFFLPRDERRQRREAMAATRVRSNVRWVRETNPHSVFGPAFESVWNNRYLYGIGGKYSNGGQANLSNVLGQQTVIDYDKGEPAYQAVVDEQEPTPSQQNLAQNGSNMSNQDKMFMYSNTIVNEAVDE